MSYHALNRALDGVGDELDILRTRTLSSIVEREIGRMVYDGELTVGDHINEYVLAARLGVSRGPVREACRKLEQAGLLRCVVNRGMFVREFTQEEVMELYDLRAALIGYAGRQLARHIVADQLAVLEALIERMETATEAGDSDAYYPINLDFHAAILAFGGRRRILTIYAETDAVLHLFRRRRPLSREEMNESNDDHREMVKALRLGNISRVGVLMERHAQAGKTRIGAQLDRIVPAAGSPVARSGKSRRRR
jgi:DNA-binding GntR family transcriptional regulator